jgi:16S rRNA (uracil1498-N3)-methyltransferase
MVLRLKNGDLIHLTDGKGNLYEARIADSQGKKVSAEVISLQESYGKRNYHLHLAVAPTKNIERFEWFIEKATEIGVDEITPLICKHSERRQVRTDRLVKIATSAVKQSLKAYHPVIHETCDFNRFITVSRPGQLFIAHQQDHDIKFLKESYKSGNDVTIMIGPEGDFNEAELELAAKADYSCVSLGSSRLRTETAAMAACHTVFLLNS